MKKSIFASLTAILLAAACVSGCASKPAETSVAATAAETTVTETTASETIAAETTVTETTEAAKEEASEELVIRIGAMSGPTAMGMVKLMSDNEEGNTENAYQFADLAKEASAMVTPLAQGELDIACVPSNLAATLYNKTNGGVQVLAVNALGVLNLVERGDSLTDVTDLAGRTIYATGQSAVPEYTIRYILSSNGIDPDNDLEIHWCADTTEALSFIKEDTEAAAILPQPFATAAMAQVEGLRIVQDLNEAWAKLDTGCEITTGVTVVRTAFAKEHPEAVEAFLEEYKASAAFTAEDTDASAALIEKYGIVAKAPLAKKALPGCHIVCITGSEMKSALEGFLNVLFEQNPKALGGAMPGDDFYYGL